MAQPLAHGQQIDPCLVEFNGTLYLFWSSNTQAITGGDYDILVSTLEGELWSAEQVLIQNDAANDHTPAAIVYQDTLYLFWSSDDRNITQGTASDIVYMTYDGSAWSAPADLTAGFNDMGDYSPFPVIYEQELLVLFEWFSSSSEYYEIGLLSFNGDSWSGPIEITSDSLGSNSNPAAVSIGNKLILVWESADPRYVSNTGDSTILSTSFCNNVWSSIVSVSGNADGLNLAPCIVEYNGKAWVSWASNSEEITVGPDFDIVGRWYENGAWALTTAELTPDDSGSDTSISMAVYEGLLIECWISDDKKITTGSDTDLVMSYFDGTTWNIPQEMSVEREVRNDGGGLTLKTAALAVHQAQLFVVWETNASPDITAQPESTWLLMATYDKNKEPTNWLMILLLTIASAFVVIVTLLAINRTGRKDAEPRLKKRK